MPIHANNIVLGAGKLYFDMEDASGNKIGERYLGDTPGFSIEVTTENTEVYDSDGAIAEKLINVATRVTRQATITCQDISLDNLALFVIGARDTVAQTATPVTDEAHTVQTGMYYQLGVSSANPTGVRGVSSVTVTDATDTTTYVLDTDYELDAAMGRIYIIPGAGISDDDQILVDYTPTANSRDQVASSNLGAKFGALRYIADNTEGTNRDVYAPRVQLRPNGTMDWKSRESQMQMEFSAEFLKTTLAAVYIDGRPAA